MRNKLRICVSRREVELIKNWRVFKYVQSKSLDGLYLLGIYNFKLQAFFINLAWVASVYSMIFFYCENLQWTPKQLFNFTTPNYLIIPTYHPSTANKTHSQHNCSAYYTCLLLPFSRSQKTRLYRHSLLDAHQILLSESIWRRSPSNITTCNYMLTCYIYNYPTPLPFLKCNIATIKARSTTHGFSIVLLAGRRSVRLDIIRWWLTINCAKRSRRLLYMKSALFHHALGAEKQIK